MKGISVSYVGYPNLRAEMSRLNLGLAEMADGLNWNRDTLARKLAKKSPLNLDEAFMIQKKYFPDHNLKYLFGENDNQGQQL